MENKIIDVTLRDGGFTCDFNWSMSFAQEYYGLMCKLNIDYIELGYWKQSSKSKNRFYNLNQDIVDKVTNKQGKNNVAIMVDYHYCSKDLNDYPTDSQHEIKLIRLTARRDLIDDALEFAKKLRKHTNLEVSFNIFNITSYTDLELDSVVDKVINSSLEYVYMADTHGHLDLNRDMGKFEKHFRKIKKTGKKTGFHLHNHTGKAYMNYIKCKESLYVDLCDTSVMSLGKGAGNLKLEDVLSDEKSFLLNEFIFKHYDTVFKKTVSPYYLVTGRYGITDNYATQAEKLKIPMNKFINFCCGVSGLKIDNFDKNILKEFCG
jgi:4-hydroxy 2-oxovalerate aldolase